MHLFATGATAGCFLDMPQPELHEGYRLALQRSNYEGWYIRVFPQRESEELLVVALTSLSSFSRLRVPGNNDSYKKHKRNIVIFRCWFTKTISWATAICIWTKLFKCTNWSRPRVLWKPLSMSHSLVRKKGMILSQPFPSFFRSSFLEGGQNQPINPYSLDLVSHISPPKGPANPRKQLSVRKF